MLDAVGRARRHREEVASRAPRAYDIDLRRRDPARELEAFRAGFRAGDDAREGHDLVRPGGTAGRGQIEPVPAQSP